VARARRAGAARPWSKTKETARELSPDEAWAAEIRAQVLADCHPAQRDAVEDPARYFAWLVGRGGGKTTAFKARYVIEMAAIPKARFVFGAPTLGMASELLWEPMKATCHALEIEATWQESPREGGKIVTFRRTGARLKLFGADDKRQVELLRGQPFNGVGADEAALWPPELLAWFEERIIGPRLGERRGWLGLASSPGHILRGPFFEATRPGGKLHRPYAERETRTDEEWFWSSHAWDLESVAALPDAQTRYPAIVALWEAALALKKRKGWGDTHPIWLREYRGRWAADATTTVFKFDPEKNLWNPAKDVEGLLLLKAALAALPAGHTWHFVVADDMGHGDPFACNVFAFSPTDPDRRIWHVYWYERTGMYARPIAELTIGAGLNATKPAGIFGEIGWPDAAVIDADKAIIEELSNVYGIRFEKAERKPDYKFGAIELTNGDLVDARIKVLEGSPLHTQLQELQWAETSSGVLKENPVQPNHSTDCLVYGRKAIARLFESGAVSEDDAPARGSYVDPQGLGAGPALTPRGAARLARAQDEEPGEFGDLLTDPFYADDEWGNTR
jgi:hypothetical protein